MVSLESGLEHVSSNQLYSLRPPVYDDDSLVTPFPALAGEEVTYVGRTKEGVIALSKYRLFIQTDLASRGRHVNVPLGLIEQFESRDIFDLVIYCKDGHIYRCTFATNDACVEWNGRLGLALRPPAHLHDVFAFRFYSWCKNDVDSGVDVATSSKRLWRDESRAGYNFDTEVDRLGFKLGAGSWRISYVNEEYKCCKSYPKLHIVPEATNDEHLREVADYRACRRFPSVVWRDTVSGAVIARCSQPEMGWLGWRSVKDEKLLQHISDACMKDQNQGEEGKEAPHMLIVDARSYTAAVANRAKGGGCECPEYYPNCDIQFMNLANIHSVRKSFLALRTLLAQSPEAQGWLSAVENTKWLHHIAGLLRSAVIVVNAIRDGRPVLVHCSDGWDRTPQVVTLAQLMLDPYYRTTQGFRVLIEREWLDFGHKFADRCGVGVCGEDVNERCPVFLQWLDCVHQLLKQFPCYFEFNEAWLVKLVQHTYSCLFGTFLSNTAREREETRDLTCCVWTLLGSDRSKFTNHLYKPSSQTLRPSCHMKELSLWWTVYTSSDQHQTDDLSPHPTALPDEPPLTKTRSCDNIRQEVEGTRQRRLSDPSVAVDTELREDFRRSVELTKDDADMVKDDMELLKVDSEVSKDDSEFSKVDSEFSKLDSEFSKVDSEVLKDNTGASERTEGDGVNGLPETECDIEPVTVIGDDQTLLNGGDCEACEGRMCQGELPSLGPRPFESSTDTLTGDLEVNSTSPSTLNTGPDPGTSGSSDKSGLKTELLSQLGERSTSTSDISDSRVPAKACPKNLCSSSVSRRLNRAMVRLKTRECGELSTEAGDSQASSTSSPSTPAADTPKVPGLSRQSSLRLDADGLTSHYDPVQRRLVQIQSEHSQLVQRLRRQIARQKQLLQQYHEATAVGCSGRHRLSDDEILSVGESEEGSSAGEQSASSDTSWETVDTDDAHITMWLPDHAVNCCGRCNKAFNLVCRRHHCRNCGEVFCGDCCQTFVPVPAQQLTHPVRVCTSCYHAITSLPEAESSGGQTHA